MTPGKIVNITNGITPRRWLHQANPALSALITEHIGRGLDRATSSELRKLAPLADDAAFRRQVPRREAGEQGAAGRR